MADGGMSAAKAPGTGGPGSVELLARIKQMRENPVAPGALDKASPATQGQQRITAQNDPVQNQLDIIAQQVKMPGLGSKLDVLASYFVAAGIFYQSIAAQFGEHGSQVQNYQVQAQDTLYQMLKFYS